MSQSDVTCSEILSSDPAKDRAEKLQHHQGQCACESISVSAHSPCRVSDDEYLIRVFLTPKNIDPETGRPNEAAFQSVTTFGLSTLRQQYMGADAIERQADLLIAIDARRRGDAGDTSPTELKLAGYGVVSVAAIRSMRYSETGARVFCALDTGKPDQVEHADIFMERGKKADEKRFRKLLRDSFQVAPSIPE